MSTDNSQSSQPETTPAVVAPKEIVYFINSEEEGLGAHANSLESALQWLAAFLENLDDGDAPSRVVFFRRDMTKAEIDALPQL